MSEEVNNTVELDSPPGAYPRGVELLNESALKDTPLSFEEHFKPEFSAFFGNHEFTVKKEYNELFEQHREKIKENITALYNSGKIRYGSW